MKYSELKKILREYGCKIIREGANHEIWYSEITRKEFPVGRHDSKEVATGTQKSIFKQAGLK